MSTRPLVLVTGASGFIGRPLVGWLAHGGWQVRAASRQRLDLRVDGAAWVPMPDLGAPCDWSMLVRGVDHVVHLAGIAHSRARLDERTYLRMNTEASGELARAAAAAGVSRFVLLSSVRAQNGPSAGSVVAGATAPAPTDAYGRSKLAAELAVAAEYPDATMLRPVLVIGPGAKGNLAQLSRLARARLPLPFEALHNKRSLLGLDNLLSIIAFCLTAENARGRQFLAADPEPMSVRDLVASMRQALDRPPGLVAVPPALLGAMLTVVGRGGLMSSLLGDLRVDVSALTAAGWRPVSTTADEIIRMMTAVQASASSR